MQKAIQQNARKTANHLQGSGTEVLGKISGVKVQTEVASEPARQTLTQNWRQLSAQVAHCAPMGPKFSPAANSRRNSASRPEKMNTAARRNRFYAKRRSERMKWDPFWKKWVRPFAFAFYGAPASIDGISRNNSGDYEFLRRHMGFMVQTGYGVSPNDAAARTTDSQGLEPTRAC